MLEACQKDLTNLDFLSRMNFDDNEFTVEEIEASLKKLKYSKADGLQPEHLKYGGPLLTFWLKPSDRYHTSYLQGQGQRPSLLSQLQQYHHDFCCHEGI